MHFSTGCWELGIRVYRLLGFRAQQLLAGNEGRGNRIEFVLLEIMQ